MKSITIVKQKSGVSILRIDTPGRDANYISQDCIGALEDFLNTIERQMEMVESDDEIKAVIVVSAKEESFITGPLLSEYLNFTLADEGRTYSLRLHELTDKIEHSRTPFVAAIRGECLGLGLELALSCNYRIAARTDSTVLGMNQVDYGLVPFAGGMQRLTRLIGTKQALDMIIPGEPVDAEDSLDLGLVDEVLPEELLLQIAETRALELAAKELKPKRQGLMGIPGSLINENPVARKMLFKKIRNDIRINRGHNNNASMMAAEALELGMSSYGRGLHAESVYFGELAVTGYSRQLIKTSLAVDDVKWSDLYVKSGEGEREKSEKAAVIGAGEGASGIACMCADNGIRVRVKCADDKAAGRVLKGCSEYFTDKYRDFTLREPICEKKLDLISATSEYTGFRRASIIIEYEGEDAELKKEILSQAESVSTSGAVYVTCSFALPVSQTAADSGRPDRTLGMNILGILNETELLEVSVTDKTSDGTVAEIVRFCRGLGKIPLVVKDGPGFFTTRVWLAYLNESLHLLGEGVLFDDIEEAMTGFGFSEGPFSAIDETGVELIQSGLGVLSQHFGERLAPHPYLELMIEDGRLGVSTDLGFYKYLKDEKRFDKSLYKLLSLSNREIDGVSHDYIQERMILAMVNESLICLEQGVIPGPKEADVASVLGLGFPHYKGGPFRYIDSRGAAETLKKLHNLSIKYGARYTPPPLLKDVAVGSNKFYED